MSRCERPHLAIQGPSRQAGLGREHEIRECPGVALAFYRSDRTGGLKAALKCNPASLQSGRSATMPGLLRRLAGAGCMSTVAAIRPVVRRWPGSKCQPCILLGRHGDRTASAKVSDIARQPRHQLEPDLIDGSLAARSDHHGGLCRALAGESVTVIASRLGPPPESIWPDTRNRRITLRGKNTR